MFGTLSGSLDVSQADAGTTTDVSALSGRINPAFPYIAVNRAGGSVDSCLLSVAPIFGSNNLTFATSETGDFLNITEGQVIDAGVVMFVPAVHLPGNFVSGSELSATMSFAGMTLDSMGITPGSHVFELRGSQIPDNDITLRFAATPLPPALPLGELALPVMLGRRRA